MRIRALAHAPRTRARMHARTHARTLARSFACMHVAQSSSIDLDGHGKFSDAQLANNFEGLTSYAMHANPRYSCFAYEKQRKKVDDRIIRRSSA